MTERLRVVVVGGTFARTAVAPAYERHDGFEVVDVVSSRTSDAVASACRRPEVDLVSVHAAPHQHREMVDRAFDAGKHVICDKPFGADLADAEHMAGRAREHSGLSVVTFEFRYQPWRRAVRDLLAHGILGPLESVDWVEHHAAWRTRVGGWQLSRTEGGGWMGAMAAHIIDTLAWWSAESPQVTGAAFDDEARLGVADRACELALRVGAARAVVVARGSSSVTTGPRVLVSGAAGTVELAAQLTLHGVDWPDAVPRPAATDEPTLPGLLDAWCDDVVRAVAGSTTPELATFADGLAWAKVRHAALGYAALATPGR